MSAVYPYDESTPLVRLSEIDRRIFRLVAQGFTSKQIARQLNRSPLTIDTRIKEACARLGADTRAQAATMVLLSDAANTHPEIGGAPTMGIDPAPVSSPSAHEGGELARHAEHPKTFFLARAFDQRLIQVGLKVLLICVAITVAAYLLASAITAIQEVFLRALRG